MCDFCRNVKTGNDFNPLLTTTFECGMLGDINSYVYLGKGNSNNAVMKLENITSSDGLTDGITISYCPICGEKL